MTIAIDLKTGRIIHAVEGRSKEAVLPFLKTLAEQAKGLKAISIDMNGAYESAIREVLPNIDIVFDRFHVVALLNKAVDEIRCEQQHRCDKIGLKTLKGQRFLLLRNFETLKDKEKTSVEFLLEANRPLSIAHTMKEQLRMFWMKSTVKDAARFIGWWIIEALEVGITQLAKTARTLLRHMKGLLAYYKHGITNAKTEGVNNKIKTLKRQAYGFGDIEYFKLRLYHLHKQGTSLVG